MCWQGHLPETEYTCGASMKDPICSYLIQSAHAAQDKHSFLADVTKPCLFAGLILLHRQHRNESNGCASLQLLLLDQAQLEQHHPAEQQPS